jgi:DNA mismatch repair protein MutS2
MTNSLSDSALREKLASSVPVLRGDRQVLAVKVQYKNNFSGIVHEMSQTGQTVFIEPEDVVLRNNDLIQAEYALEVEIRRIIKEVCSRLKDFTSGFEHAHKLMMILDMTHACASYAIENRCAFIQTSTLSEKNDTKIIDLKQARHPLLGQNAVPVDVCFPDKCRILIITGPNTGGKTVTLKTIALLSLMNQAGFPVPVNEYSVLPVFEKIFADIGDTQSIDESLSTFSGHMKKIALSCKFASEKSLVLLDELGSGTDPLEGGALAMAVLDRLLERKAFVIVTTHHGILKNYAYTHENCINASVEIDSRTLTPTYRIIMGLPGESHALDIAKQSGLDCRIVENARKYMKNENADVSVLIKTLTEKYEELNLLEKEARKKEKIISEKWRKVDLKDLKLRQKEMELREQGYKKSRIFIDENRRMLENLVRELREGEVTREKTIKVKETISALEAKVQEEKTALSSEEEELAAAESLIGSSTSEKENSEKINWKSGMEVFAGASRQKGVLIDRAKKGYWNVQFGSLKMAVKETALVPAPESKKTEPLVTVEIVKDTDNLVLGLPDDRVQFRGKLSDKPVFELRLLGMRVEDALKALERQIDLCVLNSFKSFSIVHGKGTGALQEAVHKMLSQTSCVSEFHFARPEEGGTGKTYVQLN